MSGSKTVTCATHGVREKVLVCNHVLETLKDGTPRGLHMWLDQEGTTCAWCNGCNAMALTSGTGPGRVPLKFQVEIVCGGCFSTIRAINGGGVWSK